MSPIERVPLGRTGLTVSGICFGMSALGNMPDTYGYAVDTDTATTTIRAIFDSPINFLDTSRNYGFGRSEERIGSVIHERGGLPQEFVISTKLDRDMNTGRFDADHRAQHRRPARQRLEIGELERRLAFEYVQRCRER